MIYYQSDTDKFGPVFWAL